MSINLDKYKQPLTEDEKQKIKESIDYSEEKFYRLYFGWSMIFPELSKEEIESLTWSSFVYYSPIC